MLEQNKFLLSFEASRNQTFFQDLEEDDEDDEDDDCDQDRR